MGHHRSTPGGGCVECARRDVRARFGIALPKLDLDCGQPFGQRAFPQGDDTNVCQPRYSLNPQYFQGLSRLKNSRHQTIADMKGQAPAHSSLATPVSFFDAVEAGFVWSTPGRHDLLTDLE